MPQRLARERSVESRDVFRRMSSVAGESREKQRRQLVQPLFAGLALVRELTLQLGQNRLLGTGSVGGGRDQVSECGAVGRLLVGDHGPTLSLRGRGVLAARTQPA